jgi:tRNA threonylcarbamoyladenosine biosynthesis protein TsaE
MNRDTRELFLSDESATARLAARLAQHLVPGLKIWLSGGLGAGKTTFVRALLAALGHTGRVRSPTFTLHEPYLIGERVLHHFDLYRFNDPREWQEAGFDELVALPAISLIEWPGQAEGALPHPDLEIALEPVQALIAKCDTSAEEPVTEARRVTLIAHSPQGEACLRAVAP